MMRRVPQLTLMALLRMTLLSMTLLGARSAQCFETLGAEWVNDSVSYRINPNFPQARSGSDEQQLQLLRCAADTWRTQSATAFRFNYAGTTTGTAFNPNDGVNRVFYTSADGGDALAATLLDGIGNRFTGFDIAFFARSGGLTNIWNGPEDPDSGTIDIAGVAVHEFGHALGLGHSATIDATMFGSARNRGLTNRSLHSDDIAGAEFVYGSRNNADTSLAVTRLEPEFGPSAGDNEVVVHGRNFTWTSDSSLRIDGSLVSRNRYEIESCDLIRIFNMPAGDVGRVNIQLTNEIGSTTLIDGYRYGESTPLLASIDPNFGPSGGGIAVTLHGSSFKADMRAFIGASEITDLRRIDDSSATGTLPAGTPGTEDVRIEWQGEASLISDAFTYTAKHLRIAETQGSPGQSGLAVPVIATSDESLRGVSFAFTYDPSQMSVESIRTAGTSSEGAEFAAPNIDNDTGVTTFGLVMSFQSDEPSIPAGNDVTIAKIMVTVSASVNAGDQLPLDVELFGGSPPIALLFTPIDNPDGETPYWTSGRITVGDGPIFLRGDADSSGEINITDAIYLLAALFQGGPLSSCLDAADSNDDGSMDISDAVYDLGFLFTGGPPPPPPYPETGVDPTSDGLDCQN